MMLTDITLHSYIEVLICTYYKQAGDECFYLWDTFKLNLREFYEH